MGILSAENNISYDGNTTSKIYIIKEVDYKDLGSFVSKYKDLLEDGSSLWDKVSLLNTTNNTSIRLVPLLFPTNPNSSKYDPISITKDAKDVPNFDDLENYDGDKRTLYFYTDLCELKYCPLLDFTKAYYVFEITNKTNLFDSANKSGLSDVISFSINFSVNGQSSCDLQLNNTDYKYNFKYFNNPEKFKYHLKCFFDTNDIIIIRMQKKNTTESSLLSSFKRTSITDYKDLYTSDEHDPLTTIFTGYINNINESFSYDSGVQTLQLQCTGPSKKLTWTRVLVNKATASRDSSDAILPMSAFIYPQTVDAKNRITVSNKDVIKYLVVRTYSGLKSVPELKEIEEEFNHNFDLNVNNTTDAKLQDLEQKLDEATSESERVAIRKEIDDYRSNISTKIAQLKTTYNNKVSQLMNNFIKDTGDTISIRRNTFFDEQSSIFVINGTDQPAYQFTFDNYTMFQSNFNTVYQFIKSISDNLLFNFYDDPYGVIHFSVPDITLQHLQRNTFDPAKGLAKDPNVLDQIITFSQTQDTESIANVQPIIAQSVYGVDMSVINNVVKDYASIKKYGEKTMQPCQIVGITNTEALKYAAKMRMLKYNRKALANISVQCQGIPDLKMDKYAYIKELKKLFYVESYSHNYQAGGNFTTSIVGTYLRDILAQAKDASFKTERNLNIPITSTMAQISLLKNLDTNLGLSNSYTDLNKMLLNFTFESNFQEAIYQIYVDEFDYPKDIPDIKKEVMSMYTKENLSNCYLDGYFWALPFDVNPYVIAEQIQKEEQERDRQLTATVQAKQSKRKKVTTKSNTTVSYQTVVNKVQGKEYYQTNITPKQPKEQTITFSPNFDLFGLSNLVQENQFIINQSFEVPNNSGKMRKIE